MANGIQMGDPTPLSKEQTEWYKKFRELEELTTEESVFSIEGEYYLGNRIHAVKEYLRLNPSKKFIIWVKDNYKQLS